jgi:hypothetical protein
MNRQKPTRASLRTVVEGRLHRKISDSVWQYAIDDRMVSQFEQGDATVEWLAEKVAQLAELGSGQKAGGYVERSRRQRRSKRIPSRLEAISCYVAGRARARDDVQWFRRTFLDHGLLQIAEIEPWIIRQHESHPVTRAVILRLPAGTTLDWDRAGHYRIVPPLAEVSKVEGIASLSLLDYPRAGSKWVQRIPVGPDGPLGHLHKVAGTLAESYGWQQAQATGFVLTDLTPEFPEALINVQSNRLGGLGRIGIVVDPFFTPAEVARIYGRIRSQVLSGKTKGLSEKHARLAIYALEHPSLDRSSLQSWNVEYPQWAYARLNRFKKEALASQNRLKSMIERRPISLSKSFNFN